MSKQTKSSQPSSHHNEGPQPTNQPYKQNNTNSQGTNDISHGLKNPPPHHINKQQISNLALFLCTRSRCTTPPTLQIRYKRANRILSLKPNILARKCCRLRWAEAEIQSSFQDVYLILLGMMVCHDESSTGGKGHWWGAVTRLQASLSRDTCPGIYYPVCLLLR